MKDNNNEFKFSMPILQNLDKYNKRLVIHKVAKQNRKHQKKRINKKLAKKYGFTYLNIGELTLVSKDRKKSIN